MTARPSRCHAGGAARGGRESRIDICPSGVPLLRSHEPKYCWRAFIKNAIVTCAGPAGEMKYQAQAGLSRVHVGDFDARPVEWYSASFGSRPAVMASRSRALLGVRPAAW